jgi:hypothetical protein
MTATTCSAKVRVGDPAVSRIDRPLLEERLTDSHHHPANQLAASQFGVIDPAAVVGSDHSLHPDGSEIFVYANLDEVGAPTMGRYSTVGWRQY